VFDIDLWPERTVVVNPWLRFHRPSLLGYHIDVPCAPILSVAETFENQHLRERGTVRTIDDPIHGPVDIPGMPIKWSRLPNNIPLDAPTLGQHNEVILTEMLGRSAEEIDALSHDGVLFSRNS
jgi:crotonobetainyl-CoA:carnitine CoA-transferase CaiB-like acyl-CoA transferase